MRIGMGYDVHRLTENRALILGGVDIPFEKGLLGHSDADVVVHAIMDALLGASALGDIGKHFPDSDERYKGISSMLLLEKVTGKQYRKIIAVCDESEMKKLKGLSALAESIRQFNIEVLYVKIDASLKEKLLNAQCRQKMVNA